MLRPFRLQAKLLLLVLLVLIPLFTLQAVRIYQRFEYSKEAELHNSLELAQAISTAVSNYLDSLLTTQLAMGSALGLKADLTSEEIQQYMEVVMTQNPTVAGFTWVDPNSQVLVSTNAALPITSTCSHDYIHDALAGQGVAISCLIQDEAGHDYILAAQAVKSEGQLKGALIAALQVDGLKRIFPNFVNTDNDIGLIDSDGNLVLCTGGVVPASTNSKIPTGSSVWRTIRDTKTVISTDFQYIDDDFQRIGAVVPLSAPGYNWAVCVSRPIEKVLASPRADALADTLVLLLVTGTALLATFVLGATILRPIYALHEAATAISEGDLSARVDLLGADELAAAGAAFDTMASRIQQLEAERQRFLQIAAHELRNPMTAIKAGCGLLRLQLGRVGARQNDDLMHGLQILETEVDRLSRLLDEILTAFRLQEGNLAIKFERVNLARVLHSALEPFEALYSNHRFIFRGQMDLWVKGDPRRLEDVVRNLVGNAAKYSPEGSEVRVTLTRQDDRAIIAVHDEGIGIPPAELAKIFDVFYRASNLSSRDQEGMGLGLYICGQIVSQHDGKIWVESKVGQGSTFYVEFPIAE